MGERKVLNKYFPPDFDPSKLAKAPKPKDDQWRVRMMLPMSVRCKTCGQYMYQGTKFNTRMETLETENYLGLKIFRFYFKCSNCGSEFTLKTDPKHTDYEVESGAKRNFEPWRAEEQANEEQQQQREEDTKNDTMKELEYKTRDSKMEMDVMQALDNQKLLNSKISKLRAEDVMAILKAQDDEANQRNQQQVQEDDDILAEDQERLRQLKESGAFKFESAYRPGKPPQIHNKNNVQNQQNQNNKSNGSVKGVNNTLNVKLKPKRPQVDDKQPQNGLKKAKLTQEQQNGQNDINVAKSKPINQVTSTKQDTGLQSDLQQQKDNIDDSQSSPASNQGLGLGLEYSSSDG